MKKLTNFIILVRLIVTKGISFYNEHKQEILALWNSTEKTLKEILELIKKGK